MSGTPVLDGTRAERSAGILPSSLHRMHRLVGTMRGREPIALHVGDPHLGVPEAVREAFVKAIHDGHSYYCDAPGLPLLREALAASFCDGSGGQVPIEQVFVTPGSCQAIAAVLLALAREGGAALLPEIHWPIHLQQVQMAGLRPVFYGALAPSARGGRADSASTLLESLERAYTPDVAVAIVNSPSNPSGAVLEEAALRVLHGWARRRGVWLISDEAYEDFVFTAAGARSLTAIDLEGPEQERIVFSIHTFSKSYSMTGYRLGYVVAPSAQRAELLQRVQEAMLVAPSTPVQFAGLAALAARAHVDGHVQYVEETRHQVIRLLAQDGPLWTVPDGGWYALIDLGAHCEDAQAFCFELLREGGVALAPARDFAPSGHPVAARLARVALCRERAATLRGLRILLERAPEIGRRLRAHGSRC